MHLAFLIPTIDRIGGAEQQVLLLSRGLARRGWKVTILALSGSGGISGQSLHAENIGFYSLGMRKGLTDPRGWARLQHWIKRHQPDILHAHLPHAVLLARGLRPVSPIRVLVETIHSPAPGGVLRRIAYRLTMSKPDAVTAVGEAAAEPWLGARMLPPSRLSIIPNAVDLRHWDHRDSSRSSLRRRLGIMDGFVWLSVGRLDPVKDHRTLIHAFSRLPHNTQLLLAGVGSLESELKRLAFDLAIANRVHFLGFQHDIRPWMHAADAFVLSSRWEGHPIALLEAAASELPAVVADLPAIRAIFPSSVLVPRYPVGDAEALATAMLALYRLPPSQRAELGIKMRQSVAERFSLEFILDRWESIYGALLAVKPQPTRTGVDASFSRNTLQLQ